MTILEVDRQQLAELAAFQVMLTEALAGGAKICVLAGSVPLTVKFSSAGTCPSTFAPTVSMMYLPIRPLELATVVPPVPREHSRIRAVSQALAARTTTRARRARAWARATRCW